MLLSLVCAFITTFTVIIFIRPIALRLGLSDIPGGRKLHNGVVPLIGGIAISLGFMTGAMTLAYSLGHYRSLFVAAVLMTVTGILDDFQELSPRARLCSQFIACVLISVFGHATLESLGDLFFTGDISLGLLALPITWFGAMSLINSVNMMDGIDGLAGGISLLSFSAMAFLCYLQSDNLNLHLLLILVSCLCAFLFFNFRAIAGKPAAVFMGDAGSLFLGLMLAWFSISLSQGPYAVAHPVTMLWLIALPLLDLLTVFIRRLANKRSPMQAGFEHLHYLLEARGFSRLNVVLIMWSLSSLFIAIGVTGELLQWNQSLMFIGFLALFGLYWLGTTTFVNADQICRKMGAQDTSREN